MIAALLSLSFAVAAADEPKLSDAAQKELKKFQDLRKKGDEKDEIRVGEMFAIPCE
jgi:hypothetical protein